MNRYKAYKESGIEWLGIIPEHWKIYRTKNIISLINDRASNPTLKKVALENIESTTGRFIAKDSVFEGEGIEFHKDDILFGKLRPYLAKVYKADFEGQSVGDIYVFRAKDRFVPDFLKYLFISDLFISVVDGSTYGAKMPRANWGFISDLRLALPDIEEQKQIANYLDSKVGQIDNLISAKEKQVEDLQQYRTSVISETVTRGLHLDVDMKESGIYWMGMIPCHWEVLKIGYVLNNMDYLRQPIASENRERTNPQYDYYGASGVIDKVDNYNVDDEVLLIGEDGANLVMRNLPLIYKAKGKFWVNNHAHILKPIKDNYDYLAYLLEAADYSLFVSGSAQPKLSQENLNKVYLCIPPLSEQKEIVDYLNTKTVKIDATIKELKTQIEDLRKYKTSMISEAITGKIDLRDWKPNYKQATI